MDGVSIERLVPIERVRRAMEAVPTATDFPAGKSAAVAAVFRDSERGAEVLLIRRAERKNDPWSGHMAFPGGRRDPNDPNLLFTAIRETREELGFDLEPISKVLGAIPDQDASPRTGNAGLLIRPFVFELTEPSVVLEPNEEVNEALWAPIGPLMRGQQASEIEIEYEKVRYKLPAHDIEGRIVWGLTYRMLSEIFSLIEAVR